MYRFKLEALLNHRRHQEEICQKELARLQRQLADEQEKLRRQKQQKRENVQKLKVRQKESASVSDIILYMNYIEQLSKEIEEQATCVHEAAKKVNHKRNELIGIMKKRKTLEKLKEKDWLAYQKKMMQDERKLMDEVATTQRARKK
ncbi:MAG: flagellar export protein FliJ [Desulfobacterales bacterium]|nr:MAG: flagellar export protein FliJ [Desulfobacterales bacterium]